MAKSNNTARAAKKSPAVPSAKDARKAAANAKPKPELRAVEIDDEDDAEDAEDTKGGKAKRSDKALLIMRSARISKAWTRLSAMLGDTLEAEIGEVDDALRHVREGIDKLSDDWKRSKTAVGRKTFSPGNIVQITEKRREAYDGLLEKDELDELTVIKQVGSKCAVRTAGGSKMFLPVAHLRSAE